MSDAKELIEKNRQLLLELKPQKKQRNDADVYVYQNRPVPVINWKTARDIVYVDVYFPTVIPEYDSAQSVVLHKHNPFEPCARNRFCHVVGWNVPEIYVRDFHGVWGYLYSPSPVLLDIKVNLEM